MGAASSVGLQEGKSATSSPAQSPTEDLFVLGPKATCQLYHLVRGPFQGQAPAPDAGRLRARVCRDSKWPTGALPFWVPSPNKLETRLWVQVFIWKVVPRSKSEGVGKREEGRGKPIKRMFWGWLLLWEQSGLNPMEPCRTCF